MQIIILSSSASEPKIYQLTRRLVWTVSSIIVLLFACCSLLFYHCLWRNPVFWSHLSPDTFKRLTPVYHAVLPLSPYEQAALKERIGSMAWRLMHLEQFSRAVREALHVDISTLNQQAMDSDFLESAAVSDHNTHVKVTSSEVPDDDGAD